MAVAFPVHGVHERSTEVSPGHRRPTAAPEAILELPSVWLVAARSAVAVAALIALALVLPAAVLFVLAAL